MAEMEQPVDGPFGAAPPVRLLLEAAGKQELSPAEPAGPAPVSATPRVIPTSEDGFGGRPEGFPLAGFPLRCPGGQTGLYIPSIEEMPRPPSEQGTSSLPGLATDNAGYQTASSGSDEAATGLLERYSGGHTQDHTVEYEYTHNPSLNARQLPALPPGAPTAVTRGLTIVKKLIMVGLLPEYRVGLLPNRATDVGDDSS